MSHDVFPPAWPAFGPVRVFPNKVHRKFGQLRTAVGHRLRVSSAPDLPDGRAGHRQTRHVPCVWGARRDDYWWAGETRTLEDVAAFREAAAVAAGVLLRYPLSAWAGLVPGTMATMMGTASSLYLADYWALILHHLVWTGSLPYPVRVRWSEGSGPGDERFRFASDLPTGLAEASREALILLEEAALRSLDAGGRAFPPECPNPSSGRLGLPVLRNGSWTLLTNRCAVVSTTEPSCTAEPAVPPPGGPVPPVSTDALPTHSLGAGGDAPDDARPPHQASAATLVLDDQTFTVRYGTASHRFPPRSKQLFALLERVARRPGHRVDFNDLRTIGDVWDGSQVEDSTVRGAVARLRGVLEDHGMGDLAARIQTGTYRNSGYVLLDVPAAPESDS
jgi:hypothetical protein